MKNISFTPKAKNLFIEMSDILYKCGMINKSEYNSRLEYWSLQKTNKFSRRTIDIKYHKKRIHTLNINKNTKIAFKPQHNKLQCWKFNKYDDDFFPSIPHGHLIENSNIRLDVYLGHKYDENNNKIGRESRKDIIKLWNDKTFRNFASESISYYLEKHPHHNWKVPNPKRLPRRRSSYNSDRNIYMRLEYD